jgi:hypothetical protein
MPSTSQPVPPLSAAGDSYRALLALGTADASPAVLTEIALMSLVDVALDPPFGDHVHVWR